jgi:hypothetical protein
LPRTIFGGPSESRISAAVRPRNGEAVGSAFGGGGAGTLGVDEATAGGAEITGGAGAAAELDDGALDVEDEGGGAATVATGGAQAVTTRHATSTRREREGIRGDNHRQGGDVR